MDSTSQPDMFLALPNALLVLIISFLPFKECVSTSVLSNRWRYLCHETRNIAFKESDFLNHSFSNQESRMDARASFFRNIRQWIPIIQDQTFIESFEICVSFPIGYVDEIKDLIKLVVSKKVKKLSLDFSNPAWRGYNDVPRFDLIVELPECFYSLTTLESLKIFACEFDPSRFANPGLLRSLTIGWIRLTKVESLLSKSPLLKILRIKQCWGLDLTMIDGPLRELVLENSDFSYMTCSFDLPNVDSFMYSGDVISFHFDKINKIIKEVNIEFGLEGEYDEPNQSTIVEGEVLSGFLNNIRGARKLTVCPYLLQVIHECEHPYYLLHPIETQHLVLRTKMHPKEFNGIRLLLNNCPNMKTLTFDILPPSFPAAFSYAGIDPRTYWMQNISYKCLRKTLKVITVKNFGGGSNELNILRYLIRSGGGCGVLERVEIYMRNTSKENQRMTTLARAAMLQRTSGRVQVLVHNV
ncbi:putative F-box/LRR-repeat protein [Cardamine amara subsp. amara]|uniref:F-box/LRR-repeat protein n=1 Tax=Cardamine amara subsp. amara TaxID=228776 RepID=A0ABD1BHF5_CARAN